MVDNRSTSGSSSDEKLDAIAIEVKKEETLVIDKAEERRLVRRIDLRLIPLSMFVYVFCFLDRANIGNAKILNSDTGDSLVQTLRMSNGQYLTTLLVFVIAYGLFETPSNYLLKKCRPSRWIATLMFGWGVMTMLLSAVHGFAPLVVVRFLLGAFEAGLFPGMIYCLTFWYKKDERALRAALITSIPTLAGAFGGALAFSIGHLNRRGGLQAWRWLFIIEGAPSCAFAVFVWLFYPDFPETASWLSDRERQIAVDRIKGVASLGHAKITWKEAKETLLDRRLILHYFVFIAISVPFSSISLFVPTIVSGLGYEGLKAQLFTVPPYAAGFVVTIIIAWQSEKHGMRAYGSAASQLIAGLAFLLQGVMPSHAFKARYGLLCVAVPFSFACNPLLLSWLTANLHNTGATTLAIPLNVSIAQIGQIVGLYIYKPSEAPGYPTGHFTIAGFLFAGVLATLGLRCIYVRRNSKLEESQRLWEL